ncbi:hypothetical protein L7F22_027115 [Adiantum nelumboides]|nr:hypothetical protein [Adiantum nelumboides]
MQQSGTNGKMRDPEKLKTDGEFGLTKKGDPAEGSEKDDGSSAINFLVAQRGAKEEYDFLSELNNGKGDWNWKDFVKYASKATTFHEATSELQKLNHATGLKETHDWEGDSGPVQLSYSDWFTEPQVHWFSALKELGLDHVTDGLSGENTGIWASPTTVSPDKKRSYSASAHYEPNRSRKNFSVLCDAQATSISLSSDATPKATGVHFDSGDKSYHVKARKEVILSAGTIQSPQLLELSGIGSPEILNKFGIEYMSKDELGELKKEVQSQDFSQCPKGVVKGLEKTLEWIKEDKNSKVPMMEYIFAREFLFLPTVSRQSLQGSIHIQSEDPKKQPAIEPRYFSIDADLKILAKAVKYCDEIVNTEPLKSCIAQRQDPDPEKYTTEKDFEEYVKDYCATVFHPVATCSMMSREDGGVVNERLQVYGVDSLRVVDARSFRDVESFHQTRLTDETATKYLKKAHNGKTTFQESLDLSKRNALDKNRMQFDIHLLDAENQDSSGYVWAGYVGLVRIELEEEISSLDVKQRSNQKERSGELAVFLSSASHRKMILTEAIVTVFDLAFTPSSSSTSISDSNGFGLSRVFTRTHNGNLPMRGFLETALGLTKLEMDSPDLSESLRQTLEREDDDEEISVVYCLEKGDWLSGKRGEIIEKLEMKYGKKR